MGPPQHTVSMHQQVAAQGGQVLQTQGGQVLAAAQSNNTTITTMSPLQQAQATTHPQQISTDWGHSRVGFPPIVLVVRQKLNPIFLF